MRYVGNHVIRSEAQPGLASRISKLLRTPTGSANKPMIMMTTTTTPRTTCLSYEGLGWPDLKLSNTARRSARYTCRPRVFELGSRPSENRFPRTLTFCGVCLDANQLEWIANPKWLGGKSKARNSCSVFNHHSSRYKTCIVPQISSCASKAHERRAPCERRTDPSSSDMKNIILSLMLFVCL